MTLAAAEGPRIATLPHILGLRFHAGPSTLLKQGATLWSPITQQMHSLISHGPSSPEWGQAVLSSAEEVLEQGELPALRITGGCCKVTIRGQ